MLETHWTVVVAATPAVRDAPREPLAPMTAPQHAPVGTGSQFAKYTAKQRALEEQVAGLRRELEEERRRSGGRGAPVG